MSQTALQDQNRDLNAALRDPRERGPQPPFAGQQGKESIGYPRAESDLVPRADHGEKSYKGSRRLEGKIALITGGDSGIGKAVAIAFAREGADVAVAYFDEEEDARDTERLTTIIAYPACSGSGRICQAVWRMLPSDGRFGS